MENRLEEDIVYGAEPLGPRVAAVQPMNGYRVLLTFDNGEKRLFDASALLHSPAFQPLQSEAFFRLVRVMHGTICWPGDIDYCPDTLYAQSQPV